MRRELALAALLALTATAALAQPAPGTPPPTDGSGPPTSDGNGAPPPDAGGAPPPDASGLPPANYGPPPANYGPPPGAGPRTPFLARFQAANTTGDGKLTLDQAQAAHMIGIVKFFSQIDADHKGYVTIQDIHTWIANRRAAGGGGPPPQQ
jgi:hypothetical protein